MNTQLGMDKAAKGAQRLPSGRRAAVPIGVKQVWKEGRNLRLEAERGVACTPWSPPSVPRECTWAHPLLRPPCLPLPAQVAPCQGAARKVSRPRAIHRRSCAGEWARAVVHLGAACPFLPPFLQFHRDPTLCLPLPPPGATPPRRRCVPCAVLQVACNVATGPRPTMTTFNSKPAAKQPVSMDLRDEGRSHGRPGPVARWAGRWGMVGGPGAWSVGWGMRPCTGPTCRGRRAEQARSGHAAAIVVCVAPTWGRTRQHAALRWLADGAMGAGGTGSNCR